MAILTWFPMFSESYVYHNSKCLARKDCPIDSIFSLHKKHDPANYDLNSFSIIYPPSGISMLFYFVLFAILHPLTILRLTVYLAAIHRGGCFNLNPGYPSFLKRFLLLPMIIRIHKQIGAGQLHFHLHFAGVVAMTRWQGYAITRSAVPAMALMFWNTGTELLHAILMLQAFLSRYQSTMACWLRPAMKKAGIRD